MFILDICVECEEVVDDGLPDRGAAQSRRQGLLHKQARDQKLGLQACISQVSQVLSHTASFIKPYRRTVYKCTGSRQGFRNPPIYTG